MNTFGRLFRVSIFGESHGHSTGVVLDGVPAGISLDAADFEKDLERRRSGTKGTTPRKEPDSPVLASGVLNGLTTGSPLTVIFENRDVRSAGYEKFRDVPRPGHADFTATKKWSGYNDIRGAGHLSGRLTNGLVAAGVLAKKIIAPVNVTSSLVEAGGENDISKAVDKASDLNDSIGGVVECRARNLPVGLGEPFFDSVESVISHIIFSIPAIRGIEFGAGFASARMKGSEHNDRIISDEGKTETNNAGGVNGGITNGNELFFRVAAKPTSSIALTQRTIDLKKGREVELKSEGRHDLCIALRIPVITEAAAAIALADLFLIHRGIQGNILSAKD